MEQIDLCEIEKIETENIVKNPNWFYHGFDFGSIADILEKGILAKKYLNYPEANFGTNGKYYISVSKAGSTYHPNNAFDQYKCRGPLMILNHLKVIECKDNVFYRLFNCTPFPFRYSTWNDEYHVYDKILPEKFVGIECMVYDWVKEGNLSGNLFLLRRLRSMLEVMQNLNCSLPVYDFSRQEEGKIHELDKEAFLELSEQLIDSKAPKFLI